MGRKGKSNMCIMYILWPANIQEQMETVWMDNGPVLVTGFTENIAILTRVAPATPPGSDDSDLREYPRENNLVSSACIKGPKKLKTELTWCRRPVPADPHFLSSFPSPPIQPWPAPELGTFYECVSFRREDIFS